MKDKDKSSLWKDVFFSGVLAIVFVLLCLGTLNFTMWVSTDGVANINAEYDVQGEYVNSELAGELYSESLNQEGNGSFKITTERAENFKANAQIYYTNSLDIVSGGAFGKAMDSFVVDHETRTITSNNSNIDVHVNNENASFALINLEQVDMDIKEKNTNVLFFPVSPLEALIIILLSLAASLMFGLLALGSISLLFDAASSLRVEYY